MLLIEGVTFGPVCIALWNAYVVTTGEHTRVCVVSGHHAKVSSLGAVHRSINGGYSGPKERGLPLIAKSENVVHAKMAGEVYP